MSERAVTLKNKNFELQIDSVTGAISHLRHPGDALRMNWVMHSDDIPGHPDCCGWGLGAFNMPRPFAPARWQRALKVTSSADRSVSTYRTNQTDVIVQRSFTGSRLRERLTFSNATDKEQTLVELRVYWPFNDNYTPDAKTCSVLRCNTHLWCGDNSSWAHAIRMNGQGPSLGVVLREGTFIHYGVENRGFMLGYSNFRGDLTPLCGDIVLPPKGRYVLEWDFFWCEGWDDFFSQCRATPGFIHAEADTYSVLHGKKAALQIHSQNKPDIKDAKDQQVPVKKSGKHWLATPKTTGPELKTYTIKAGGKQTRVMINALPSIDELLAKRTKFIVEKQQVRDPGSPRHGALLIYDVEAQSTVVGYRDDFNECRERIGMGVLLALQQGRTASPTIAKALKLYEAFIQRELQTAEGAIRDSIGGKPRRGYNYPWVAQFYMAMYRLTGKTRYVDLTLTVLHAFYRDHGAAFMAIGIPVLDTLDALKALGRNDDREKILASFKQQADRLTRNGLDYPAHEVTFEQSIVAPGVTFLLEMAIATGDKSYIEGAKPHLASLESFNGRQPDARLHDISIRHWDGYWFGKRESWGDVFPHHWSALTAISFQRWSQATGDKRYANRARAIALANLQLFRPDGSGSSALMYPKWVNGSWTTNLDPYANDQDWALVHLLMLDQKQIDRGIKPILHSRHSKQCEVPQHRSDALHT